MLFTYPDNSVEDLPIEHVAYHVTTDNGWGDAGPRFFFFFDWTTHRQKTFGAHMRRIDGLLRQRGLYLATLNTCLTRDENLEADVVIDFRPKYYPVLKEAI